LVVFGKGEDQVSSRVDGLFNERSAEFESILTQKCICLKLDESSEQFNNFLEFFYVASTPFIYFVAATGKLCEPIIGEAITERSVRHVLETPSPTPPATTEAPAQSVEENTAEHNSEAEEERHRLELIRQQEQEHAEKQQELDAKSEEYRIRYSRNI